MISMTNIDILNPDERTFLIELLDSGHIQGIDVENPFFWNLRYKILTNKDNYFVKLIQNIKKYKNRYKLIKTRQSIIRYYCMVCREEIKKNTSCYRNIFTSEHQNGSLFRRTFYIHDYCWNKKIENDK
jgi:predicted DNA-binding ribbon-helix-helix protein